MARFGGLNTLVMQRCSSHCTPVPSPSQHLRSGKVMAKEDAAALFALMQHTLQPFTYPVPPDLSDDDLDQAMAQAQELLRLPVDRIMKLAHGFRQSSPAASAGADDDVSMPDASPAASPTDELSHADDAGGSGAAAGAGGGTGAGGGAEAAAGDKTSSAAASVGSAMGAHGVGVTVDITAGIATTTDVMSAQVSTAGAGAVVVAEDAGVVVGVLVDQSDAPHEAAAVAAASSPAGASTKEAPAAHAPPTNSTLQAAASAMLLKKNDTDAAAMLQWHAQQQHRANNNVRAAVAHARAVLLCVSRAVEAQGGSSAAAAATTTTK